MNGGPLAPPPGCWIRPGQDRCRCWHQERVQTSLGKREFDPDPRGSKAKANSGCPARERGVRLLLSLGAQARRWG